MKLTLFGIACLGVGFGSFALYLGYDNVVVAAVFSLLSGVAGYVVGKRTTSQDEA